MGWRDRDRRRRYGAFTGSAVRAKRTDSPDVSRLTSDDDIRAMEYYRLVPELWNAAQFYSRTLAKVEFFPAIRQDNGEIKQSNDPVLIDLLDRIQDPSGGRATMFKQYGTLMFLVGQCYLFGSVRKARKGESQDSIQETWEIVSAREITPRDDGKIERKRSRLSSETEVYDPIPPGSDTINAGQAVAYRMWRPHPQFSSEADSPVFAAFDVCEELVMLSRGVRARLVSRLAGNGILVVDESIVLPGADATDETEADEPDKFMEDLGQHLTEPIGDPGSAAAVVPYLLRTNLNDRPVGDLIKLIRMSDPGEEFAERGMRQEARERLAVGLDLPPEILKGLANANHWTSWQIDEQSWEILQRVVQGLCDDFAAAYLRPAARETSEFADNWENVCIGYDKQKIVAKPDQSKVAAEARDRGAISDEGYRELSGIPEKYKPSQQEHDEWLAIQLRQPGLIDPDLGGPSERRDPPAAPPAEPPAPRGEAAIVWAAEYALERARALAGSRLRTRTRTCGACQEAISGAPNSLVASLLGHQVALEHGNEAELVAGAGAELARVLARRGVETRMAERIGMLVEEHAAETLFETEPPPVALEELAA